MLLIHYEMESLHSSEEVISIKEVVFIVFQNFNLQVANRKD